MLKRLLQPRYSLVDVFLTAAASYAFMKSETFFDVFLTAAVVIVLAALSSATHSMHDGED